jgi:dCTP deaminase
MILTDFALVQALITEGLIVTPMIDPDVQIGASSIDLRLGTEFRMGKIVKQTHFDLIRDPEFVKSQVEQHSEKVHVKPLEPFVLHPGEFALAHSLEYLVFPLHLSGRLEGRSTWGRVGLQVHSTAGIIDPGFSGSLTFELYNLGKLALPLYPGIRIAQVVVSRCEGDARTGYSRKTAAKYASATEARWTNVFSDVEYESIRAHLKSSVER